MPKYITCLSRMMLKNHYIRGTTCPGSEVLEETHCENCEFWKENQEDIFEEETTDE